jgi:hypothetical protein
MALCGTMSKALETSSWIIVIPFFILAALRISFSVHVIDAPCFGEIDIGSRSVLLINPPEHATENGAYRDTSIVLEFVVIFSLLWDEHCLIEAPCGWLYPADKDQIE